MINSADAVLFSPFLTILPKNDLYPVILSHPLIRPPRASYGGYGWNGTCRYQLSRRAPFAPPCGAGIMTGGSSTLSGSPVMLAGPDATRQQGFPARTLPHEVRRRCCQHPSLARRFWSFLLHQNCQRLCYAVLSAHHCISKTEHTTALCTSAALSALIGMMATTAGRFAIYLWLNDRACGATMGCFVRS